MTSELTFDWDDENLEHLARHDVTRADFEQVMANDPNLIRLPKHRWRRSLDWYGSTNGLRILVVAFTIREGRIRAVTAFLASKKRLQEFWKAEKSLRCLQHAKTREALLSPDLHHRARKPSGSIR